MALAELEDILNEFKNLVEVQSLDLAISKLQIEVKAEDKRLEFLNNNVDSERDDKIDLEKQLTELKKSTQTNEAELSKLDTQFEQLLKNESSLTTQNEVNAFEQQKDKVSTHKEALENQILEDFEILEKLETQIEEKNNFLKGSVGTLKDLTDEITQIQSTKQKDIVNLEGRITVLLENGDQDYSSRFKLVNKKYRFKFPLSHVNENLCFRCSVQLNKALQSDVEHGYKLAGCPNCGRLLVPRAAF